VLECVVNISEGRRAEVLVGLARAAGPALLDVHADPDHNRSVFTIAGPDHQATEAAVRDLSRAAAAALTLEAHDGVHPRVGVIDVVPFVALAPTPTAVAVDAARAFARWIGEELAVPAFLYDGADPQARSLPTVRRDAFTHRAPDEGPPTPHPRLGAVAVGARPVLVAVNVELDEGDLDLARTVARTVRERDGGLPGVRALGLSLPSVGRVQVSMNLVALDATGLEGACTAVRDQTEAHGGHVHRVELVGLVPAAVLEVCSPDFLEWSGLSARETLEARAGGPSPGPAAGVGGAGAATRGAGRANRA
jgi:glutamate formiminotransferase